MRVEDEYVVVMFYHEETGYFTIHRNGIICELSSAYEYNVYYSYIHGSSEPEKDTKNYTPIYYEAIQKYNIKIN